MRKNKLLLLLCSILISSCSLSFGESNNSTSTSFDFISESTSNTINSTISTPSLTTTSPTTPVEDLTKDDLTYLDLFNINNVISVEINMSTEELQKIQNDFVKYSELNSKSPIYRRADSVKITITIQNKDFVFEYDDVGVRMKGNTSRHKFMDENGNIYRFGYGVGKFVYLADAAEDIEKDIKQKSYNPVVQKFSLASAPSEEVKKEIEEFLNMSAGMVCQAFSEITEKTLTPIVENIIYDGMENTMNNILKGKEKK